MLNITTTSMIVFLVCSLATVAPAWADWAVSGVRGDVKIVRSKVTSALKTGEKIKRGDKIVTGADGAVSLIDEESDIHLASKSELRVKSLVTADSDQGRFDLVSGQARIRFKTPSGPEQFPYSIGVGSVVASVHGTEFFVANEKNEQRVATFEGLVRVTSTRSHSELWDVPAGKGLVVKPGEMPKVRESSADQVVAWKKATEF